MRLPIQPPVFDREDGGPTIHFLQRYGSAAPFTLPSIPADLFGRIDVR